MLFSFSLSSPLLFLKKSHVIPVWAPLNGKVKLLAEAEHCNVSLSQKKTEMTPGVTLRGIWSSQRIKKLKLKGHNVLRDGEKAMWCKGYLLLRLRPVYKCSSLKERLIQHQNWKRHFKNYFLSWVLVKRILIRESRQKNRSQVCNITVVWLWTICFISGPQFLLLNEDLMWSVCSLVNKDSSIFYS